MWFKNRLGDGHGDYGIVAGQRFRSIGTKSILWEVGSVYQFTWEPAPHVRLHRVGVPRDMKTVALETLRDHRFFEPAN
jgi:hypothetical protein